MTILYTRKGENKMTQATLDDFEKLLEESFSKSHAVADIVEGTVLRKEKDGY